MRVTSSLLAFIFVGVAAAGVIPEIAVRDNTVAGGKGGHGSLGVGLPSGVPDHPLPSGKHDPAPVSRRGNPVDVPHPSVSLSNISDHPKPTGKHSPPVRSRRGGPADIPHLPASLSDVSDHPKPTGKHSRPAGSRRDKHSDHAKPTGKPSHPAASRRANPPDVESHIPVPLSTDLKDSHSHHPAARRTVPASVPSLPTNIPSHDSNHPERTGEHSRPLASHKARADTPTMTHKIHPISGGTSPTDIGSHHHQGGSEHPKPTGKAA